MDFFVISIDFYIDTDGVKKKKKERFSTLLNVITTIEVSAGVSTVH